MGVYAGPEVVESGLILSLDAGNTKSYPGSGTTWTDLSGNGNNGTISSGEFVSTGNLGYLRNSGNTSNFFTVSISNSTSLNNTLTTTSGGWTIEEVIWTNSVNYPEADAGSVASDSAYGSGATGFDWNHGISNTSFVFGQSSNSSGSYEDQITLSISSPYSDLNTWKLRTMMWNRGINKNFLYINGVYQGEGSTPNTSGTSIYDGSGIVFGSLYGWKHYGRRSIIRIYNRVLTASEIQQNYNATKSRYGLS